MENSNKVSFPSKIKTEKPATNTMDTEDLLGDESILMEKFMKDFGLDGIGEEEDDYRDSGRGNGPSKRGKTIKKRRKQGISPNDPRKFYTDRIVNALCTGDIENVRTVMERYHEPDCVYIQRFTNNTPDLPGYREIHGRNQMLAFYRSILASSPDCVVKVTDRQLNVYQDGSSYLVSRINFSGAWLFRIYFSNIVRKTRSFISTFFNRPTILNPFRTKPPQSPESHDETTSGDETVVTESKYSPFSFSNFLSRRKADTDNSNNKKRTPKRSAAIKKTTVSDGSVSHETPKLPASTENKMEESKYLHYDMHLIEGKASVYDKSVRPPSPTSPLSVSSLKTATSDKIESASAHDNSDVFPDTNSDNSSHQMQTIQSKKSSPFATFFTSKYGKKTSDKADKSNEMNPSETVSADTEEMRTSDVSNTSSQLPNESPDVLEAEAPWQDLPFSIAKDEVITNAPIPSPAVLIVTPESEVSLISAHPKPYRVNISISNVAHINANGRIFKSEMFMKAEVSISWWPSAKEKAAAEAEENIFNELKKLESEEFDDEIENDTDQEKFKTG